MPYMSLLLLNKKKHAESLKYLINSLLRLWQDKGKRTYNVQRFINYCQPEKGAAMKLKNVLFGVFIIGASGSAHASDYGCKVLLCLANPGGPTQFAECVPPISQLWDDLRNFRPFPTCDLASVPNSQGGSYARQGTSYYDICPAGTTALAEQTYAIKNGAPNAAYLGIGSGDQLYPQSSDGSPIPMPVKTCVSGLTGTTNIPISNSEGWATWVPANVYSTVVPLQPLNTSRIIDVYIDGQIHNRVHW